VTLIDYGLSIPFNKNEKSNYQDVFKGNFLFASLDKIRLKPIHRADDIKSLLYLMLYLFGNCDLPNFKSFIKDHGSSKSQDSFNLAYKLTKKYKKEYTFERLVD
jgi:hypothetical protein